MSGTTLMSIRPPTEQPMPTRLGLGSFATIISSEITTMAGFLQSYRRKQAEKELEKRRGKSATYTQPLVASTEEQVADLEMFMAEWYSRTIFDKAAEFPRLLKQYPETLGEHYDVLVPTVVSFDEFWSRYFYRCSLTTILQEWSHQEADKTTMRNSIAVSFPALKSKLLRKQNRNDSDSAIVVEGRENNKNDPISMEVRPNVGDFEMESDIVETIEEEEEREEAESVDLGWANFDS